MPREARGPRFTFFGGKGGVGKTTCSAAAAVRAAAEGRRVLIVSTDPAHSLADALGMKLGREARRVRDAAGALWAAELDADTALGRWLREREQAIRVIADRGTYLDDEDIDRFLSLSFPGVDELVGLLELVRLSRVRAYDDVVIDTAPTGHTLRLLEMPDTLGRLGQILDDMHAKHRFLASSLGGSWRGDFADETIEDIEREAKELRELLQDRTRTSFTWVTLPEELSVRESDDAVRRLVELGVHVGVVVVNRVWQPHPSCASCEARAAAENRSKARIEQLFSGRTLLEARAHDVEPRGPVQLLELAGSVKLLEVGSTRAARSKNRGRRGRAGAVRVPLARTVRLVFVGGKGGVGKTTVAAASAIDLALSRPKDRVLLLSTDPAHSLGDVLDADVADDARRIPDGPTNLFVRELDAGSAWATERERYREGIDDVFSAIFRGRMDATFDRAVLEDLVDLAPPGIDELIALVTLLDSLIEPTAADRYDLVVVDTAPTGHTLRLLELPPNALDWVHALMSVILKYRSIVGLGELASDLTRFARKLRTLMSWLVDPVVCAFVIVSRPSTLPRLETARLAKELERLRVPVAAVVVNAVTAPACARCKAASEHERSETERLAQIASRSKTGLIAAPASFPAPRGAPSLQRWSAEWLRLSAPVT